MKNSLGANSSPGLESPETGEDNFVAKHGSPNPPSARLSEDKLNPEKGVDGTLVEADPEDERESWLQPRINIFRTLCAFYAFVNLGMNGGATGALIPYFEDYYRISYARISLLFLFSASGFVLSSFTVPFFDARFGISNSLRIGIALQLANYCVQALAPPYPALLVSRFVGGIGQGLQEAQYSVYIVGLKNSTSVLALLHAAYGLGATISPLVATAVVVNWHLLWNRYFILVGVLVSISWILTHISYYSIRRTESSQSSSTSLSLLVRSRVAWQTSAFLLLHVGTEVTLGGWLVAFVLDERGFTPSTAGHVASVFWAGSFIGRVLLAYPTERFGEYISVVVYLVLTIAIHLAFWFHTTAPFLLTLFYIGIIGFLSGPMFSTGISVAAAAVAPSMRVSIVGFCSGFGAAGAAVFPFITGAAGGPKVMNVVFFGCSLACFLLWVSFPTKASGAKGGAAYQALEMDPI